MVCHLHGYSAREDHVPEEKVYIELGEYEPGEDEEEMVENHIQDASGNGMSPKGLKQLLELLYAFKEIFE